jgi:hypothetical protein
MRCLSIGEYKYGFAIIFMKTKLKTQFNHTNVSEKLRFVFEMLKGEEFLSLNIFNMTAFVSVLVKVICKLLRQ